MAARGVSSKGSSTHCHKRTSFCTCSEDTRPWQQVWTPLAPLACNLRPRLTAYLYFKGHPKEQSCSTKYLFSEDHPPWPGLSMGQWSQGWGIFYLVSFSFSLDTGDFRDLARQSFSTLAVGRVSQPWYCGAGQFLLQGAVC